jgi:hypothetical protein
VRSKQDLSTGILYDMGFIESDLVLKLERAAPEMGRPAVFVYG